MKNSRLSPLTLFMALAVPLAAPSPAMARADLCEAAVAPAASDAGIPADILMAIALTETGRAQDGQLRPWPWAANGGGAGHWFASHADALDFARRQLAQGATSFDLGCFQINWHWHRDAFASPADLLDPPTAARYAARLLARLHDEFGSWEAAVGAYHSRTPSHAARYHARFTRIHATLADRPPLQDRPRSGHRTAQAAPDAAARPAMGRPFPLLAGTATGASLVPAALPRATPLIPDRR